MKIIGLEKHEYTYLMILWMIFLSSYWMIHVIYDLTV